MERTTPLVSVTAFVLLESYHQALIECACLLRTLSESDSEELPWVVAAVIEVRFAVQSRETRWGAEPVEAGVHRALSAAVRLKRESEPQPAKPRARVDISQIGDILLQPFHTAGSFQGPSPKNGRHRRGAARSAPLPPEEK